MLTRSVPSAWMVACIWMVVAESAAATNLLVNGDFDSSLVAWVPFAPGGPGNVAVGWRPNDVADDPASGSARVENRSESGGQPAWLRQCQPVRARYRYWVSGWVNRQSAAFAIVLPTYWAIAWHTSPSCLAMIGPPQPVDSTTAPLTTWVLRGPVLVQAPATAGSVEIRAVVERGVEGLFVSALFDAVELRAETLFLDGFQ